MNARYWQDICDAFDQLRHQTEPLRSERLDQMGLSESIQTQVLQLLESDAQVRASGRFAPDLGVACVAPDLEALQWVGEYQLIRRLGAGGMGEVFLARSQRPSRLVALKLVYASHLSPESFRRIAAEADFLARLDHPFVARVYQFGVAESGPAKGRPFVVMEYIEGQPLNEYSATKQLGQTDRIRILADLCAGVQHAHQKGVIHRDIKPANILVTPQQQPKIVDFGVARLSEHDDDTGRDGQPPTLTGHILGTLAYMSPEQLGRPSSDLDTRSDIYALGVVGYELITGSLPYRVRGVPIADAIGAITRGASVDTFFALHGDLRFVIAKALNVDPDARYSTAAEFESDLRRLLSGEAVLARPSTPLYQLRVVWRTHHRLVLAVALVVGALSAATTFSIRSAIQANRSRASAEQSQTDLRDAVAFMEKTLAYADPESPYGQEATVRQALRRVAEQVDQVADVGTRALVMYFCAKYFLEIGVDRDIEHGDSLYADARRLADQAHELYTQLEQPNSRRLAEMQLLRGRLLYYRGMPQAAIQTFESAIDHMGQLDNSDPALMLECKLRIATAQLGLGYYDETVEIARQVLGSDHASHRLRADAHILLADVGQRQRDWRGAEREYRAAIDLTSDEPGERKVHAAAIDGLGIVMSQLGRLDEAVAIQREALEIRRTMYPPSHPVIARSLLTMADIHFRRKEYEPVLDLATQAESIYRDALRSPHHKSVLGAIAWQAAAHREMGNTAKAIAIYTELIDAYSDDANAMTSLAVAYLQRAKLWIREGSCEGAVADLVAADNTYLRIGDDSPGLNSTMRELHSQLTKACPQELARVGDVFKAP